MSHKPKDHAVICRTLLRDRVSALKVAIARHAPDTPFWANLAELLGTADSMIDYDAQEGR